MEYRVKLLTGRVDLSPPTYRMAEATRQIAKKAGAPLPALGKIEIDNTVPPGEIRCDDTGAVLRFD